ncbi:MAG: hypothetical protein AAF182_03785 [Pseudomonadota bacterium]
MFRRSLSEAWYSEAKRLYKEREGVVETGEYVNGIYAQVMQRYKSLKAFCSKNNIVRADFNDQSIKSFFETYEQTSSDYGEVAIQAIKSFSGEWHLD